VNGGRARACARFEDAYGHPPALMVRAPGRVNLIGEHTDHQDGFVLPIAIDRALWLALEPVTARRVEVVSGQAVGRVTLDLDDLGERLDGWGSYVHGMAEVLDGAVELRGWRGAIDSDIPSGAGLSSSAAFELALARAWVALAEQPWEPPRMAGLAQRAENEWVGVSSGIMDQLSCALGRSGHALLIDCRTRDVTSIPLPDDLAVVIMDTGTRRELTGSDYNVRQRECARAAAALGIDSLRDADITAIEDRLQDPLRRRARHVVTENQRVLAAVAALRDDDVGTLGRLLNEGHRSMRDDFEASGPALDTIVALATDSAGCHGARLTGAGFAGCAIAVVDRADADAFCVHVADGYLRATGTDARLYVTAAADGVDISAA
jgi:galactokinase